MAKKAVATLQTGEGRTYSKVIRVVKSPKTGAYIFEEEMVPKDHVKAAIAKLICISPNIMDCCSVAIVLFLIGSVVILCYKTYFSVHFDEKVRKIFGGFRKTPYLCNVFFMV